MVFVLWGIARRNGEWAHRRYGVVFQWT
jgi:hypothetical protein